MCQSASSGTPAPLTQMRTAVIMSQPSMVMVNLTRLESPSIQYINSLFSRPLFHHRRADEEPYREITMMPSPKPQR
jgi:hypothetical protein